MKLIYLFLKSFVKSSKRLSKTFFSGNISPRTRLKKLFSSSLWTKEKVTFFIIPKILKPSKIFHQEKYLFTYENSKTTKTIVFHLEVKTSLFLLTLCK